MTVLSHDFQTSDLQKLFPIPLEPFEEYLLRDDSRQFPMTWFYECHFEGHVQRDLFENAFREALLNEPLFWAKARRKKNRYDWVFSDVPPEWIWRDHPGEVFQPIDSGQTEIVALNIMQGPGMRIEIDRYDNQLVIRCYVHHTVTDGLGGVLFLANWWSLYANMLGDTDGVRPFFNQPERIKERGQLNITLPEPIPFSAIVRSLVREVFHWFRRRPVCLEKTKTDINRIPDPGLPSSSLLLWRQLPPELAHAYRDQAKIQGVSVNSLFLRDMFLFLKSWCEEKQIKRNRHHFRVLVPINMRNEFHRGIPATNILGYVFLDRLPQQCVEDKNFMLTIDRDIKFIRNWSVGSMFLDGVRFFRRIPFILSYLASAKFCHSTTVISNLGPFCLSLPQERFRSEKTIRVAGLELKRLIGAPPVRPHTPISLGIITCGDRVLLNAVVERSFFERGLADQFLDGYIDRLKQSVTESPQEGGTHDAS